MDAAAEVIKIQRFGRYAQAGCLAVFAMLAVMGPATWVYVLSGPGTLDLAVDLGPYDLRADAAAPLSLKIWAMVYELAFFAIAILVVGYLYALFGALARGEIYTLTNVRRIRRIGELILGVGVLQIVLPMTSLMLLNTGVFPETAVSWVSIDIRPDSFSLMIAAGLVLLVSWIMEIGRRTRETAEELRREAELVV